VALSLALGSRADPWPARTSVTTGPRTTTILLTESATRNWLGGMATEGLVNLFSTTVGVGGIAAGTVGASGTLPVIDPAPAALSGLQFAIIVNPGQSNQEIMEVTAGNQTTGWTVTRGSEGLGTSGAASAPQHFANE